VSADPLVVVEEPDPREESPVERLARLAVRVGPVSLAREHVLPVHPSLESLLAGGLQRGTTVAVSGVGATTLGLVLAAGPASRGSWAAVVGWPSLGLVAAHRAGVPLGRVAVVDDPPADQRAPVLAALVGAFDVVLVPTSLRIGAAHTRRLAARLRERGSVLVRVAGHRDAGRAGAAAGADLHLRVTAAAWEGLGTGHGHLRGRRVRVELDGRGAAGGRTRRTELWLPGPDGTVRAVEPRPAAAVRPRPPHRLVAV
jgi:hypothetical protein